MIDREILMNIISVTRYITFIMYLRIRFDEFMDNIIE